jgi:hypothetical protein
VLMFFAFLGARNPVPRHKWTSSESWFGPPVEMVLADPEYVRHNRARVLSGKNGWPAEFRHQPVAVDAATGFIIYQPSDFS